MFNFLKLLKQKPTKSSLLSALDDSLVELAACRDVPACDWLLIFTLQSPLSWIILMSNSPTALLNGRQSVQCFDHCNPLHSLIISSLMLLYEQLVSCPYIIVAPAHKLKLLIYKLNSLYHLKHYSI